MRVGGFRAKVQSNLILAAVVVLPPLATLVMLATGAQPSAAFASVTICHKPGTPDEKTLVVNSSAEAGHYGHGDYPGPCVGAPPTSPPTSPPTPPPTSPPTSPPGTPPTVPPTAPPGVPPTAPPDTPPDAVPVLEVAGSSAIRTDSSEVGRARVAGEAVRVTGVAPDGCRPVLRIDGTIIDRVDVGRDGSFDVDVVTDELSAGRHVAEVVCSSGVVVRKAFWIAAPVTSTEIFSVGMLAMLTLGGLGWVGIKTVRDTVVDPDTEASSTDE